MKTEILVGSERRRRCSADEKARILSEATAPGAKVVDIARRHGVSRSLIYRWRREASRGLSTSAGFSSAILGLLVTWLGSDR